jgi:hypothetical protein
MTRPECKSLTVKPVRFSPLQSDAEGRRSVYYNKKRLTSIGQATVWNFQNVNG